MHLQVGRVVGEVLEAVQTARRGRRARTRVGQVGIDRSHDHEVLDVPGGLGDDGGHPDRGQDEDEGDGGAPASGGLHAREA